MHHDTAICWACEGQRVLPTVGGEIRTCPDCKGTGVTSAVKRAHWVALVARIENEPQPCVSYTLNGKEICVGE